MDDAEVAPTNSGTRRSFVGTKTDIAAISHALRESFPFIVYLPGRSFDKSSPPSEKVYPDIQSCQSWTTEMYIPDAPWRPEFSWKDWGESGGEWQLQRTQPPILMVQNSQPEFLTRTENCRATPQFIQRSWFVTSFDRFNPDHKRKLLKVTRILNKVMTSKLRVVSWPGLEPRKAQLERLWAGHDAIRWYYEDKSRVLFYESPAQGEHRVWIPA